MKIYHVISVLMFVLITASLVHSKRRIVKRDLKAKCSCPKYSCACQFRLTIEIMKIDITTTMNVSYIPEDYDLHAFIKVNDWMLYDRYIGLSHLPGVCPSWNDELKLCLHLINGYRTESSISSCAYVTVYLLEAIHQEFKISCFEIPLTQRKLLEDIKAVEDKVSKSSWVGSIRGWWSGFTGWVSDLFKS